MMKNYWLIILIAALGAGCGKKKIGPTPKPPPTQPKVTEKPKPLPPALVAAWEQAGFEAGWMGPDKASGFIFFDRTLNELDASKAVPAFFTTRNWKPGLLESLPAPETAFGLRLWNIPFPNGAFPNLGLTNAGLEEVAKLKQLARLFLSRTQITVAGMADLKKALPKCKIRC